MEETSYSLCNNKKEYFDKILDKLFNHKRDGFLYRNRR